MQQMNTLTGGIYFGYYKDETRRVEYWVDKLDEAATLVCPMRIIGMIHRLHYTTPMKITEDLYTKEIKFMRQQLSMYGSTKMYSTEYQSPEHKQCESLAKCYEFDVHESEFNEALLDPDFIYEHLDYEESSSSFNFIGIENMCRIHNTTHIRGVINPDDRQYLYTKYP